MSENSVFDAARTLLSVREYQDKDVPEDILRRAVDAARLTASAMNKQPWHFVLVRDRETLREFGKLMSTGPYIANARAAVVVGVEKNPYAVSDASRAIQSMMLTAWAEGVGSNWVGFGHADKIGKQVGLPDEYDVLAVVAFGYPKRAIGKGKKNRLPLAQVASAERFGTPLE
jgi:nitroreductase